MSDASPSKPPLPDCMVGPSEPCAAFQQQTAEIERLRDRVHSEEFVVMFLGYLTAKLPELHRVEAPRVMDAWNEFKLEMGKRPCGEATPPRPFAWWREEGGETIFARGDWPPPEPDDTAWLPLYRHPEVER